MENIAQAADQCNIKDRELHEKVKALYSQTPLILVNHVMIAVLLMAVLFEKNEISLSYLFYWSILFLLVVILRSIGVIVYSKQSGLESSAAFWGKVNACGAFLSGILWGGGCSLVILMPLGADYQTLAMLCLSVLGAGALSLLTPYLPAFYAYFVASMLPFLTVVTIQNSKGSGLLIWLMVIYCVVLIYFARRVHANFSQSIQIRLENGILVNELRRQKEEAEKSNIAKSRFLAAASHDLRQPMHALGLFVETLRERILFPDLRKIVDQIGVSVEAMNDLFNALLDISKLDAGVIVPNKSDFSLRTLLERVRLEYETQAKSKKLILKVFAKETVVHSDAALLERILRNFLTNAMRYTPSGRVVVGCRKQGDCWLVAVWDTGLGIPESRIKDIFQEFVQLDNPERDRSKGLGLGLAIVDRLANLLEHEVIVRSIPGKGSMFGVKVPAGKASFKAILPEQTPFLQIGLFANKLILVVDDEAAILEGMRGLLEGWGCEVIAAGSGQEMSEKVLDCSRVPDLIISDYRLRNQESGIEVIQSLQNEFNEGVPAILITGDTAPDRLQEAKDSGFELLHKPLQPAKLRALIGHLLQKERESKAPLFK